MRSIDRMAIDADPGRDAPTRPIPIQRPGAPARGVTVSVHGDDDVVVTTRGPLDDAAVLRISRLLEVVEDDGARHVIVDVTASPEVPAAGRMLLDGLRGRLAARGGWLLVEGAGAAPHEPSLLEVFVAYVDAVAVDAVAVEVVDVDVPALGAVTVGADDPDIPVPRAPGLPEAAALVG